MKVALCLSGFMRSYRMTFQPLARYLLAFYDVDIFIHTWNINDISGGEINQNQLKFTYDPKKMIVEKYPINFAISDKMKIPVDRNPNSMLSMFYKIRGCNELRKQFERESGIKYDCVIRFRPDLELKGKFEIIKEDLNYLNIPKYGDFAGINDQVAFGSGEIMDKYSEMFNNIYQYAEDCQFHPEPLMKHHIEKTGLQMRRPEEKYVILRPDGVVLDNETRERQWGLIK